MILFSNDWLEHNAAIPDFSTKNHSFVRLAKLYNAMGIKNHLFPLALLNPDLKGIDPRREDLPPDVQFEILKECKLNPFYLFREVLLIPGGSLDDPIRFGANRANMAYLWLFCNHVFVIIEQPRQTGKSVVGDCTNIWSVGFASTESRLYLLTKEDTLRANNLDRFKNIYNLLPSYLKMKVKADIANTEEFHIGALGNKYIGLLPNKSPKLAQNVGRGLTGPIFQIDEGAYFYNIHITLPAALPARTAAVKIAKRKGEPYCTTITTTSGKKDEVEGKYIYDLIRTSATFTEKFYDLKDAIELEKVIRINAKPDVDEAKIDNVKSQGAFRVHCIFNHRQLGYTDEWLVRTAEETLSRGEDFERDYLLRWTDGTIKSPLSKDESRMIRESVKPDAYADIFKTGHIVRWYIPEQHIDLVMSSSPHVISLDTSDASGNDDIALHIRNIETGGTVAAGDYNEDNLISICEFVVELLLRFPNSILIPERRFNGGTIIDYILKALVAKGVNPFKRIYNTVVQHRDEDPETFKEISKRGFYDDSIVTKHKKHFGFTTSGSGEHSRSGLYGMTFYSAVKNTGAFVRDRKIADELLSLTKENGRIDHPKGGHDDMVIAWLLTYWFMSKGKHLDYYGIDSRRILCKNQTHKESNQPLDLYKRKEQQLWQKKVEDLTVLLKETKEPWNIPKLESELKYVYSKLDEDNRPPVSVDEYLNKLRDERSDSMYRKKSRGYGMY